MSELDIPQDWEQKTLIDLADYVNGFPFKPSDWSETGLPIVRIAQITGSATECDYFQGSINNFYKLENGDIVFSWSGTLCVVRWHGGQAWLNQHLFRVIPSPNIDRNFFFHLLSHAIESIKKSAHGSTMKHIKRGELKKYNVATPVWLAEQQKIAQILDTLDTQIQKTEALITKLEKIKEGLLHDLLTRGVDQNGQLRLAPEQAPDLYKESALGLIPKEWEAASVYHDFDIDSGFTLGAHRKPIRNARPYLRVANVHRGRIDLTEIAYLEARDDELEKKSLSEGDLLIVEGHASPNEIGRCAIATEAVTGFTFQNHLFRLRAKTSLPHFAFLWMNSQAVKQHWRRVSSSSSGLYTINRTKLESVPTANPAKAEQLAISTIVKSHENEIAAATREHKKLIGLKVGITDDLLTGHVRVTSQLKDLV